MSAPTMRTMRHARLATLLGALLAGAGCAGTQSMGAGATPAASAAGSGYDVVIANGRIVDGTGNPWFYGDVAIRGDRIAAIGRRGAFEGRPATRRIDATGMVVAPGFIDIQSGGGAFLNGDSRSVSKLTQGVTT